MRNLRLETAATLFVSNVSLEHGETVQGFSCDSQAAIRIQQRENDSYIGPEDVLKLTEPAHQRAVHNRIMQGLWIHILVFYDLRCEQPENLIFTSILNAFLRSSKSSRQRSE